MTLDHKKPGVAFWSTVVMVGVLGYVASFGPACWVTSRAAIGAPAVNVAYRPMMWAWGANRKYVGAFLAWYAQVGAAKGWTWTEANTWRKLYPY
jgi:hypothetical protein